MFSLTNSEKILQINSPLFSPIEVDETIILCSYNGEIIKYSEGQLKLFTKLNGQIRSIAFDSHKNTYYIADLLRQSVIALNANDGTQAELVNEYEGESLEGPNSIVISNKSGNIFFTDSGAFGETHSPNEKGSLFIIDMSQQSIRPLALRCLSCPSGLAFNTSERAIYVAETGKNRILRFFQSNEGIYYMSVFHQFNGRFGPTALNVTNSGLILTALFEFKSLTQTGSLGILNEGGDLLERIKLPQCGPEISGMFISRQTQQDVILLILYLMQQIPSFDQKNLKIRFLPVSATQMARSLVLNARPDGQLKHLNANGLILC